jgi:hypothetical protein
MRTIAIGVATSSVSSQMSVFSVAGRCTGLFKAACTTASRGLHQRKEALGHRLEEFALELLAAIVVAAIFLAMTKSEASEDF